MPEARRVRGRIVAIGNSRGVRIPKLLLEQAGLDDEVELLAGEGRIVITAANRPRAGWGEAASLAHSRHDDALLQTPAPAFDAEEWEWE